MDCYSFTDENSLQADLHLPLLSDSELPIASNIQRSEIIPDPDDIIYTGMTSIELESNLETTEIPDDPFADNLDLSLYTVDKGCDSPKIPSDSTDTDSPPMLLGISPLPRERTPEKDESNSEGKYGCLQKRRRLSTRHSPQQTFQECSQCGKSFSSASALSKHYLTHSHERRHVCRICNKAFKRQDHLSGHLLTHQKNKPYVCMEHGCDKSYCDSRSLRRHYEVQHGLYCQREPWSDTCKDLGSTESALYPQSEHVQASHEGDVMPSSEAHIESLSQRPLLPNRELLRCLTSSLSQKIPCDSGSSGPASVTLQYPTQGHAVSNVLSSPNVCSSDRSGMVRQAKCNALQREHSAGLNCNVGELCPQINPAHLSVTIPNVSYVENLDTSIMDSLIPTRPQPPPYALEAARPASWPQAVGANHTLSKNETISSGQQASQDLVWTNNLATYSGSKGSYSYIVPNSQPSEEVSTNFSSGALHKLDSFAQAFTRQNLDIQSSPSASRPQGENSRVSEFDACGNVFRQLLSYKANLNQWPSFPEQKRQLLQEQYSLHQQHQQQIATSLFTQVYMGEQEAISIQNQDPFQNHMLQLISDTQYNMCQSQNLVSQSQVTVTQSQHIRSQKISGQAQNNETQPHQLLDLGQDFSSCLRQENAPFLQFQTAKPAQQVKSTSPYHPPQVAEPQTGTSLQPKSRSLSECHKKSRKNPFKVQPPPQVPPLVSNDDIAQNQLQGLSEQADNRLLPPCSKRGRSSNKEASFKYCIGGKHSKNTSSRKERQKLDPNCTAPPSQVAMNSFTVQGSLSRSMDDSHQIVQAEDMYNISTTLEEGGDGSSPVSCASQTLEENGESIRCERCSQEVIMGKQHTSEDGNKSQQATDNGIEKMEPGGLFFQYLEDKLSALLLKKPLEEAVVMPLVIPVSVPVKSTTTMKDCKPGKSDNSPITPRKSVTMKLTDLVVSSNDSQVQVSESDRQTVNCTDIPRSKKRRKRARPEPLFIPSPAWSQTGAASGMVLYQSQMRSPVCLADHLLEMNFHTPPYTPPPMLSPIRQGSGLYFNRVCSATGGSALLHTYTPKGILSCILDSTDGFCGISVVKDDSVISIEPHINIGSRFQAEIPQLRDKSLMIDEEPLADLVWKPWGDIETNKVTQKTVTDLLNMACSSVLPGGGTNNELALHCLHDTRGDVLAALEMLLMKSPSRELSHPLRDYHYTGTEKWTCSERKMFNKAICIHNKDFFLMQKMIKFKSVAQCVEYYYTWKKQLKFEWNRTHPPEEEEETRHEANTLGESKETKKLTLIVSQNLGLPCPSGGNREKPRKKISRVTPSPSPSAPCPTGATDKNGKAVTGGDFPCRECAKVFDKVKSRNAHMKCHRQQEEQERRAEIKRSRIHLKVEVEEKPELKDLIAHVDNLQNITAP